MPSGVIVTAARFGVVPSGFWMVSSGNSNPECYTRREYRFTPCLSTSGPRGRHRGTVPRRLRWKR
jgi:hypothetical protein